jgi:hypothetical protein
MEWVIVLAAVVVFGVVAWAFSRKPDKDKHST